LKLHLPTRVGHELFDVHLLLRKAVRLQVKQVNQQEGQRGEPLLPIDQKERASTVIRDRQHAHDHHVVGM
jgi:hypothetical protein